MTRRFLVGGVAGALATHADDVTGGMTPERQTLTRSVMLRLVTTDGSAALVWIRNTQQHAEQQTAIAEGETDHTKAAETTQAKQLGTIMAQLAAIQDAEAAKADAEQQKIKVEQQKTEVEASLATSDKHLDRTNKELTRALGVARADSQRAEDATKQAKAANAQPTDPLNREGAQVKRLEDEKR